MKMKRYQVFVKYTETIKDLIGETEHLNGIEIIVMRHVRGQGSTEKIFVYDDEGGAIVQYDDFMKLAR